ncbi:MAG: 50S ribosomal protein L23 [Candidatus Aenigmarchaeota archaeon]|nr:50S ribosomal protein L23 [Candidatus Aenigmarchaeota archaeon]
MAEEKKMKAAIKKEPVVQATPAEAVVALKVDPYKTVKFVLMTEKAVQSIERDNKIVFVVDMKAEKDGIKKSVESMFAAPVTSIRTSIDQKRRKRAYVKFKNAGAAGDIAIKLGII